MEFRLLGPVEIWVDTQRHELGSAKERAVLAVLLLNVGQTVPADALIDRLWDADPPPKARATLYSYVARLRRRMRQAGAGDAQLVSGTRSYQLDTSESSIDLYRFRALSRRGKAAAARGDHDAAESLFREAEGLWQGEPLSGLTGRWWHSVRTQLQDERLDTIGARIDVQLDKGRHADLVPELAELVSEHPLRESLVGQLMVALYGAGRAADAQSLYLATHRRLDDELAVEPSRQLRDLYVRIISHDAALLPTSAPNPAPSTRSSSRRPRPNSLLRDVPEFTGRTSEIARLLAAGEGRKPPMIAVITGLAGVGKTALATHLAHRLSVRYPDAQLHLDLGAHRPDHRPVTASRALGILLAAIGVPPDKMPADLDERAAVWRARMADRRAILVLDDAADPDQIRRLLPGTAECHVLVTSRQRLVGLEGAQSIRLDVLPQEDAVDFFRQIVADAPRTSDTGLTARVVEACGRLPLQVRLAGERFLNHPSWSLEDLAQHLRDAENPDGDTSGAFTLSYRGFTPAEQRAFRHLGLLPGRDLTAHAAAAMAETTVAEAERTLDALFDHYVLEEPARGRYRLHDLVKSYARKLPRQIGQAGEGTRAIERLLAYYLTLADRADRAVYPYRRRPPPVIEYPPADTPKWEDADQAAVWLEEEYTNLIEAANYAAAEGLTAYVAHLPQALAAAMDALGGAETVILHTRSVGAWQTLADPHGEALARYDLAKSLWRTGEYERALQESEVARGLCADLGDRHLDADLLDLLSQIRWHTGHYREAVDLATEAFSSFQRLRDQRGAAGALMHAAIGRFHLGDYATSLSQLQHARTLYQRAGGRLGQVRVLNNLGVILLRLGRADEAGQHFRRAHELYRPIDGRHPHAILRHNLGSVHQAAGRPAEALESFTDALARYRAIGDSQYTADVLYEIASLHLDQGRLDDALHNASESLELHRIHGDPAGQARALRIQAAVDVRTGRFDAAGRRLEECQRLTQRFDDPYEQAKFLFTVAVLLQPVHGPKAARTLLTQALQLFEELAVPDAAAVRAELCALDDSN